jgi:hypothetical protein
MQVFFPVLCGIYLNSFETFAFSEAIDPCSKIRYGLNHCLSEEMNLREDFLCRFIFAKLETGVP